MPFAVTITYIKADGELIRIGFNAVPSGTYPTGGDAINLATANVDPNFIGSVPEVESTGPPIDFDFWDVGGNIVNTVFPIIGTSVAATGKVKFTSAFGTELANSGYPGSITGSKFQGEAVFNKV